MTDRSMERGTCTINLRSRDQSQSKCIVVKTTVDHVNTKARIWGVELGWRKSGSIRVGKYFAARSSGSN